MFPSSSNIPLSWTASTITGRSANNPMAASTPIIKLRREPDALRLRRVRRHLWTLTDVMPNIFSTPPGNQPPPTRFGDSLAASHPFRGRGELWAADPAQRVVVGNAAPAGFLKP